MDKERTKERVINVIARTLDVNAEEVIEYFAKDFQQISVDSLDAIRIAVEIEYEFDISIPDERVERLRSAQKLYEYVLENIKP